MNETTEQGSWNPEEANGAVVSGGVVVRAPLATWNDLVRDLQARPDLRVVFVKTAITKLRIIVGDPEEDRR
jgi:hypothetical protein